MSEPTREQKERASSKGQRDAERDTGAGLTDLLTLGLASDSSYDPPSDPTLKEKYNEGWYGTKG
jgi:hypothetical protein